MSESATVTCCFLECASEGAPSLRLEVTAPPDGAPVVFLAHEACFNRLRAASVDYDDPADHGRIPARARCAFCGSKLPIVGQHPFVFDVGNSPVPQRLWAHPPCLTERLTDSAAEELKQPPVAPT